MCAVDWWLLEEEEGRHKEVKQSEEKFSKPREHGRRPLSLGKTQGQEWS